MTNRTELIEQIKTIHGDAITENFANRIITALLEKQVAERDLNIGFYKCCLASGETPTEGDEPYPTPPIEAE